MVRKKLLIFQFLFAGIQWPRMLGKGLTLLQITGVPASIRKQCRMYFPPLGFINEINLILLYRMLQHIISQMRQEDY